MHNDEQGFDFLAAAEDTGRQLDELIKVIPGEVRETLAAEYRKSPWLAELPQAASDAKAATERMEAATIFLNRSVKIAGMIVCLASVIIPLALWGLAEWNLAGLRKERLRLERENGELIATMEVTDREMAEKAARWRSEVEALAAEAAAVKAGVGGIELVDKGDSAWLLTLPADLKMEKPIKTADGRLVISYTLSR